MIGFLNTVMIYIFLTLDLQHMTQFTKFVIPFNEECFSKSFLVRSKYGTQSWNPVIIIIIILLLFFFFGFGKIDSLYLNLHYLLNPRGLNF